MGKKVTVIEINSEFFFIEERDDFHSKSLKENDYAYHRKSKDIGIVSDYNESTGSWTYSDIENNISTNRDAYKLFKVIASTLKLENVINVSHIEVAACKTNTNIGKIINDSYCNGFFGREYDLNGSTIIAEGDGWIVVRKENGYLEFGNFQDNISEKQNYIDKWCEVD